MRYSKRIRSKGIQSKKFMYTVILVCSFIVLFLGFAKKGFINASLDMNTQTNSILDNKKDETIGNYLLYEGDVNEMESIEDSIYIEESILLEDILSMKQGISIRFDENSNKVKIELIPYTLDYIGLEEIKERLEYSKEEPYIRIRNSSFLLGIGSKGFKISPEILDLVPRKLTDLRIYPFNNGYIIQRDYEEIQEFNSYLNVDDLGLSKLEYYKLKVSIDKVSKMEMVANYQLILPLRIESDRVLSSTETERNLRLNIPIKLQFNIHD